MYPTNQYMDPYYSHYRNHTPYPYYPPHGWEASRPEAMDSSYRPPSYGPWPYNAGMHHPHPSEFHCCCSHTYPPGYHSFRPPFPQELPPPHLYYHGPFSQHPNACPSYFVPPRPYPVDQTPYGPEKFKSHCCGCPNHVCHGGERSNMKIEEEKPDGKPESEQKDADSGSIIRHPNHQYPFIWLPSGNMEGKENGRRYELPPQFLNGWDPMGSKRTGDVKKQEQDDQKEKQFQWPIVWMPAGYDEPKQKAKELKEVDESPKVSEEASSPKIKIIPLSWFENSHHDQKPAAKDGSGDHNDKSAVKSQPTEHQDGTAVGGHHKTTPVVPRRVNDERKPAREVYKTIPVVPEKEIDEKKVGTCRTIPVMTQKESDEKKPAAIEKKEVKEASNAEREGGNGKTNHGESAKAKHSKLPPVCLRVDPLPKKKSGNGSSRSPSPPTRKDADKAKKEVKTAQSQNLEAKQSDTKKEITVSEAKEKSPDEMKKGMGISNETVQAASVKHSKDKEIPTSEDNQKVQAGSVNVVTQENAGERSLHGGDKTTQEAEINNQGEAAKVDARACRTNLSEPDAAVRIQSAYRGYDVRRWQPLDKLRKIRDVHEQMQGVRKQLQSLEASSKKPTEKEQVAISETIMNLLLKLDTIQGLHPSVREARKSVARELTCLQEKLDSLCMHPSGEEEKPETAESVIQTADPISSAEASVEQEKARRLDGAQEPSSMESMELCGAVVDPSEQKHQIEESSATTIEKAPEEGKAAQVECQGASLMDMMNDAALSGHSTDERHQIEESNDVSKEVAPEEDKAARQSRGLEVPLLDSLEQLHDGASSGDSSELKQTTASSEQNLHTAELNACVSPAVTGDNSAATATASVENGEATDKDGPVEGQAQEAAAVETAVLQHELSLAEDQHKESSAPVVNLEDSSVCLKDAEPYEHDPTPTIDSVMSNVDDQPEARDISMLEEVADTAQDSTKEPDGTSEASMNDSEFVASAESEKPVQVPLPERASESDSAPEQTVLEESDNAAQSEVSGKDDSPHVDQRSEPTVHKLAGGSATVEDPLLGALRKEPDLKQSHPNLAQEADDTMAETVVPELDSRGLSYAHEGAVKGYEMPEERASSRSQTDVEEDGFCEDSVRADVEASEADECNEMPKEVPVCGTGQYSTEADTQVSETDKCSETPQDAPVRATGSNSAEEEADTPKEDVAVQTENKASQEAISASATPDGLKDSDEKNLAEENQKLKEMLQKLLASGNDQMGVIEDLSQKVKVLERKLARKKKPKVRVHRPARHPTAKVH